MKSNENGTKNNHEFDIVRGNFRFTLTMYREPNDVVFFSPGISIRYFIEQTQAFREKRTQKTAMRMNKPNVSNANHMNCA